MRDSRLSHAFAALSVDVMTDLALLGTGRMGGALAVRLCETGYRVTVWNRSRARTAAAAEAGATVAATPAEAVTGADLVITMLADGPAVEAALFSGGAAAALQPGAVLVQMSTIAPAQTKAFAERLPPGVHFVDAPVGGSVDRATVGTLDILIGGDPAAVDRAEPVLKHLGALHRCGAVGTAATRKLLLNTAMLTALGALHDTLAVATALGVDEAAARDLLASGPLAGALRRATSTTADFPVALAAKDLRLARAVISAAPTAVQDGHGAPVADAGRELTGQVAGAVPVADAVLRLLAAVPDQQADLATLSGLPARAR